MTFLLGLRKSGRETLSFILGNSRAQGERGPLAQEFRHEAKPSALRCAARLPILYHLLAKFAGDIIWEKMEDFA
jgi:hypothetical protein